MPASITILRAIRDSGGTFEGMLDKLPGRPYRGERSAWNELRNDIGAFEGMELVIATRDSRNEFLTIELTDLGRERLQEAEDEAEEARIEEEERKTAARSRTRRRMAELL